MVARWKRLVTSIGLIDRKLSFACFVMKLTYLYLPTKASA